MTATTDRTPWFPTTLLDRWRDPSASWGVVTIALTAALVAGGGLAIYAAGGARTSFVHLLYAPILLAAIAFRVPGGIAAAVAAGMVAGPLMPFDTVAAIPQETSSWLLRLMLFVMVGGLVGLFQALLQRRLREVEHLAGKLAATNGRTLSTFASTVDLRDEDTGGHSARVAHNALAVARALALDENGVRAAYWGGLLHDLGKIAVPEHILRKPGRLTEAEVARMRRHSAIGAELLAAVSPDFAPISRTVRSHHERWDGTGYPDGVAGPDIPLTGRIVTVVDVFEALTCARPYRDPSEPDEALAYLRSHAGIHFDPNLVPLLEELYREGVILTARDPLVPEMEEPPPMSGEDAQIAPVVVRSFGIKLPGTIEQPA